MPKRDRIGLSLGLVSLAAMLISVGMVFGYAPREATMGEVQRIFYFHVASAWVGFFAFFVTALGGIVYLVRESPRGDGLAHASAEIGLTFITTAVVTGSLWARPVWGTYWTWEPRLTISAVQWLLYVAYLMLRNAVEPPARAARFAAVYGIIAFVTVPLSWFAIRWWRTIHPDLLTGADMAINPAMLYTLLAAILAFTLLYGTLLWQRLQLEAAAARLAQLRAKILED